MFYTKEKSLIFYAYDLDQQGGNPARTFQAWGRRGPDFKQAVSLGIFYEDNASKKRWVLKSEDPKTLAQIDAVFVTVEPHGGSDKPKRQTSSFRLPQSQSQPPVVSSTGGPSILHLGLFDW